MDNTVIRKAFDQDMKAFFFDVEESKGDFDVASHQKFGLIAYFL